MKSSRNRPPFLLATAACAGLLAVVPSTMSAAATSTHPTPGAAGIGDSLFPTLGNGGYDAQHYDLALRYATSAPTQGIDGTVTMHAVATQSLSRFDLDFSGKSVGSVTVNAAPARFERNGEELVITPARPIAKGARFTVTVKHFTADPAVADPEVFPPPAFIVTPDGSATAGQPNAMHSVYPSNDHSRDKASFSFHLDVPTGETAVANGVLTGKRAHAGRTVWSYEQRQPMATELTQIAAGSFTVLKRGRVNGVPVRDVVPTRLAATLDPLLAAEKDHLKWMENIAGPYPFDTYGSLVVEANIDTALETQTLSIFDSPFFTDYPEYVWSPIMLHELSHQWFGDNVSPSDWSDLWLNEGHAQFYEYVYADEKDYLADDYGFSDLEELMKSKYAAGDLRRAQSGPVAQPSSGSDVAKLYSSNVYNGGALVLYALGQKVGPEVFAKIERAWVRDYAGRAGSTKDYIALASKVARQDLSGFLTDWLYGMKIPPMPGHPDWVATPVPSPSVAARTSAVDLEVLRRH
jgi:aminopeptidase N